MKKVIIGGIFSVIVAVVTGVFSLHAGQAQIINIISPDNQDKDYVAVAENLLNDYNQNKKEIEELKEENNSLLESGQALSEIQQEKELLEEDLKNEQQKNQELQEQNQSLQEQVKNMPSIEYKTIKSYLDGVEMTEIEKPIALVNGKSFYNEDLIKQVFGHYNTGFELETDKLYIGEKKPLDSLPLSKATLYDKSDGTSINSGECKDLSGNKFSGILITNDSYDKFISFLVNKNYNKISGVIHVADQTPNGNEAKIEIYTIDENSNEVKVFSSPTLTNLSEPVVFSGVDITNAKIVRIEQSGAHGWGIHAVISDAYFYNE